MYGLYSRAGSVTCWLLSAPDIIAFIAFGPACLIFDLCHLNIMGWAAALKMVPLGCSRRPPSKAFGRAAALTPLKLPGRPAGRDLLCCD